MSRSELTNAITNLQIIFRDNTEEEIDEEGDGEVVSIYIAIAVCVCVCVECVVLYTQCLSIANVQCIQSMVVYTDVLFHFLFIHTF